ncbi:MAG: Hemolysin-related protein [Methanophagales archaeon]|nr:Hemolysin-related protein [Methanophagales archaeon]
MDAYKLEGEGKEVSWLLVEILVLLLLLLLSAFFSGSETALVSIGRVKAKAMLKRGEKHAEKINKLLSDPDAFLSAVLIGNNLVNIAASAIATSLAIRIFGGIGVGIATGVMTFVILTFCEVLPKTLAMHHAERFAAIAAPPLTILVAALKPVSCLLSKFTKALGNALGYEFRRERLSEDEVRTYIAIGEEEGAIEEDEREMMEGVLRLDEKVARDVMTPKEKMVCLDADKRVEDAVELIRKFGYSRIPVYERNPENIVGVIYAKDILTHDSITVRAKERERGEKAGKTVKTVRDLMKKPFFVPETKRIDELLQEFQRGKMHIAIVVDDKGRAKGIVSLEDLLEEIVGSIYDEYDLRRMREKSGET